MDFIEMHCNMWAYGIYLCALNYSLRETVIIVVMSPYEDNEEECTL
jgi:hypothetical protein